MRGIDISNYQGWPLNATASKGFSESDFVIVKATEGTGYTNPYFAKQADKAIKAGKLLGLYHYADGGDPTKEAAFFASKVASYVGEALLFVDWEGTNNPKFGKDTTWCRSFLDELHRLTGVRGGVYVSASAVSQVKTCHPQYLLWVAGYPYGANSWSVPKFPYKTAPWPKYDIWQFTSSGGKLDRNTANITREEWEERERIATAPTEYVVKLATNVRTRRNLITGRKVYKLSKGQRVSVDRIVKDAKGRTWGHIGKYRWFVISTATKVRAVKA